MTVRARLCCSLASCIAHVGASVAGSFNVWSYHRGFRARCVLAMGAASCQRAATHMLASVPLATLRCYHHSGTRRWAASVHAAVVSAVGFRENGARLCVRTCCGGLYRSVSAHHMCVVSSPPQAARRCQRDWEPCLQCSVRCTHAHCSCCVVHASSLRAHVVVAGSFRQRVFVRPLEPLLQQCVLTPSQFFERRIPLHKLALRVHAVLWEEFDQEVSSCAV